MSDNPVAPPSGERLAKVIARSGMCSRRDAEDWIRSGRVAVNGSVIRTPAYNVTEKDKVSVDGKQLAARSGTRVWMYHKPPGLVVTEKDPEGRATIFEALTEAGLPRVLTVGRLDLNTEGLLLLTNDGGLKRVLELPATGWLRRYRVRAFGRVTQAMLDGLKQGIEVDGIKYGPIDAQLEREQGSNVWLVVSLREGKNREVKNVLASLGLQVNRLIRISYGPFQLGDLAVGAVEVVRSRVLRDQLGSKLAEAAGADFDSEVPESAPPQEQRRAPAGARRFAGRPDERGREQPEKPPGRPRRVFFDDGRAPEEYVPKEPRPGRRDADAERSGRPGGPSRDGRPPRGEPRSGGFDGPKRGGARPDRDRNSDRPARPPRGGQDARPGRPPSRQRPTDAGRPARSDSPRGAGRPDRDRTSDRPARPPRGGQDARPGRPPSRQRPADASRPARSDSPRGAGRPDRDRNADRPARPTRAGQDARPGRPPSRPRPADTGKPSRGAPRAGAGRPDRDRTSDRPARPARAGQDTRPSRPPSRTRPVGAGKSARPGGSRPTRPGGGKPPRPGARPPRKPRS